MVPQTPGEPTPPGGHVALLAAVLPDSVAAAVHSAASAAVKGAGGGQRGVVVLLMRLLMGLVSDAGKVGGADSNRQTHGSVAPPLALTMTTTDEKGAEGHQQATDGGPHIAQAGLLVLPAGLCVLGLSYYRAGQLALLLGPTPATALTGPNHPRVSDGGGISVGAANASGEAHRSVAAAKVPEGLLALVPSERVAMCSVGLAAGTATAAAASGLHVAVSVTEVRRVSGRAAAAHWRVAHLFAIRRPCVPDCPCQTQTYLVK